MLTPVRVVLAVLLPAVLACGCSGDDEGPSTAPSGTGTGSAAPPDADAIREDLVALWVGDDARPEDTETGRCFADALTERTTADQLRDAGVLDASYDVVAELPFLDREGAELWVDAQLTCVDYVAESGRAQAAATKGKVDRAAYEDCLREALTDEEIREAAVASVMGELDGEAVRAFSAAQLACVEDALPPD